MCDGFFGEKFGLVDIVVYCCTFNLFRYVMVPTWRDLYPKISFLLFPPPRSSLIVDDRLALSLLCRGLYS